MKQKTQAHLCQSIEPYNNDEEFLRDLEDALLEYLPWEIYIDRAILESAKINIDHLIIKYI